MNIIQKLVSLVLNNNHRFINNRIYNSNCANKNAETICALASGRGKAGVSVIRISGTAAQNALIRLCKNKKLPKERVATFQTLINPYDGDVIDKGIVIYFPAPRSFTGEDVCELQVHGSQAVVNIILKCLTRMNSIRLAEPGEFARRALYNNKMDLTQVEGLADLIDSETEEQRKLAQQQANGVNSKLYESWRNQLIRCISYLQAEIDFSETDDLNMQLTCVQEWVLDLQKNIKNFVEDYNTGASIREGIQVVLYGAPNVGKSSIYNILCCEDRAIVSSVPGTTRDVLEAPFDIGGFKIRLVDTAGIHGQSIDIIENVGIHKALDALRHPNTHLHILYLILYIKMLGAEDFTNPTAKSISTLFKKKTIIAMNKVDRLFITDDYNHIKTEIRDHVIFISCAVKMNGATLLDQCTLELQSLLLNNIAESPRLTSLRQKCYLEMCLTDLNNFLNICEIDRRHDAAMLLQHLKYCATKLACITGKILNEEVLDHIFKNFCVGK